MSQIIQIDAEGGEPSDIAFAGPDEVRVRMGRSSFTPAELAQVKVLLSSVAGLILDEVGRTDAWALATIADSVPRAFRIASIEAVTRVMQNPRGVRSQQEALGDFSHSESYADSTAGLDLTAAEVAKCKRAVGNNGAGSARLPGVLDIVAPHLGETGARHLPCLPEAPGS